MKKNKMMRLASGLLVACLLTSSIVSGTFAKYTTGADASDTARVAKWGVQVTTSGHLFNETYAKNDAKLVDGTLTVVSVNEAKENDSVVAPGTANTEGITFSITGKPEVKSEVKITVTGTETDSTSPVDIYLGEGTYLDLTTGTSTNTTGGVEVITNNNDEFTIGAENYYPVVFTLTHTTTNGEEKVTTGTLKDVEKYLEDLTNNYAEGDPNVELGEKFGTFTLTWAWAFENVNDKADTFLGNLAADPTITSNEYSLKTNVKIVIEVTQVD